MKSPMSDGAGVAGPCGAFVLKCRKNGPPGPYVVMKSTARWVRISCE
jgi:hypothetical protein